MRDLTILFVHLVSTLLRLLGPGGLGLRSVVAETLLVRHQLSILNRSRERAPNLRSSDRIIVGLCALWMRPSRILRSAVALKPSKGPSKQLIEAIVEMKRRNTVGLRTHGAEGPAST